MARTIAEIEADITSTRSAITACLKAQRYSASQNSKEMPRLPELRALLKDFLSERASVSGVSQVTYPSFQPK